MNMNLFKILYLSKFLLSNGKSGFYFNKVFQQCNFSNLV